MGAVPALRHDDVREAPPSNENETLRKFLLLHVHESRQRKRFVPLADTRGRILGLLSPPGEIPNFGAGDEI